MRASKWEEWDDWVCERCGRLCDAVEISGSYLPLCSKVTLWSLYSRHKPPKTHIAPRLSLRRGSETMGRDLWSHGVCLTSRGWWKPQGFRRTQKSCFWLMKNVSQKKKKKSFCRSPCSGFYTSSLMMGWSCVWAANHFKVKVKVEKAASHTLKERVRVWRALISYLCIALMEYIHIIAKYVNQVKMNSRLTSSKTCLCLLFKSAKNIHLTDYGNPYCAYDTLCSSVKAFAVYDSWDGVNTPLVFSLLYFQISPPEKWCHYFGISPVRHFPKRCLISSTHIPIHRFSSLSSISLWDSLSSQSHCVQTQTSVCSVIL